MAGERPRQKSGLLIAAGMCVVWLSLLFGVATLVGTARDVYLELQPRFTHSFAWHSQLSSFMCISDDKSRVIPSGARNLTVGVAITLAKLCDARVCGRSLASTRDDG